MGNEKLSEKIFESNMIQEEKAVELHRCYLPMEERQQELQARARAFEWQELEARSKTEQVSAERDRAARQVEVLKQAEQSTQVALQEALLKINDQRCLAHESRMLMEITESRLEESQMRQCTQLQCQNRLENELERVLGEANRLALRDCEYVQEVRAEMVQGEMNALRQE